MKYMMFVFLSLFLGLASSMALAEDKDQQMLTYSDQALYPEWFSCHDNSECVVVEDSVCHRDSAVNTEFVNEWKDADSKKNDYLQTHVVPDYCGKPGQTVMALENGEARCQRNQCVFVLSNMGSLIKGPSINSK